MGTRALWVVLIVGAVLAIFGTTMPEFFPILPSVQIAVVAVGLAMLGAAAYLALR